MKKILIATVLVAFIALLSGCLTTLHPLFTEKDLVFDPRLIGTWSEGPKDEVMIIEKGSAESFSALPSTMQQLADKAYMITMKEKNSKEEIKYYGFLAHIGHSLYLDFYPAENYYQKEYEAFYKQHYVPMHSFYRVRFNGNQSFETSQFDRDYLGQLIDKKQVRIQHEVRSDGSFVITAPTEELQQYVLKYGDVKEAYESTTTYNKVL